MAGTGQVGSRGSARLLMVCAVLAGLFLMHGAPATAAAGCHGAMSAPAPMDAGRAAPMTSAESRATVDRADEQAMQVGAPSMAYGATCVSTPVRDRPSLPAHTLVAVVTVLTAVVLGGRAVALGRSGRRGPPPPGGRTLLLRVGIART